jgi:hypothetical protein
MALPELICDTQSRSGSVSYYERHWPDIMTRKNFNHEPLRWTCLLCGVENIIRGWCYHKNWQCFQPIITPRIYLCHNSSCMSRRFYWRDNRNQLFARYLGKYELIDELEFTSAHDPLKFYSDLKLIDPKQITLF